MAAIRIEPDRRDNTRIRHGDRSDPARQSANTAAIRQQFQTVTGQIMATAPIRIKRSPATGATTGSRSEPVSGQRSDRLIPPIRITAAIRRQFANHGKPTAGIQPISSRITAATEKRPVFTERDPTADPNQIPDPVRIAASEAASSPADQTANGQRSAVTIPDGQRSGRRPPRQCPTGSPAGQTARPPDRQIRKQEQRPRPIQTRPARDFLSGNFPFYIREFRFFIREFRYSSWRDFLKQPRNGENFISGKYPGILIETGENDTKQGKTVISASSGVLSCKSLKIKVQKNGGGGWIRTIEVSDSRFTVCPLWPLGNPTTRYWSG